MTSTIAVFSDRIIERLRTEFEGKARVRHFPADVETESKKPRQYAEIWVAFDGRSSSPPSGASLTQQSVQRHNYGFNLVHLNKDLRGADSDYRLIYEQIDTCLECLSGLDAGAPDGQRALLAETFAKFRSLTKDFWVYEQRFELVVAYTCPRSNSRRS